jgi:hypothetical protein
MGQADPAPLIVEGALYSHKDLDTKKGGLLDRDYRKKQKAYTVFLKWGVLSQWFLRRLKFELFTAVSTKLKELFLYEPATSYMYM